MSYKHLILVTLLILVKNGAGRSLTFVVDTTASMAEEIDIIKSYISVLIPHLNTRNNTNFEDFGLIQFNDQEYVTASKVQGAEEFVEEMASLQAGGGSDCPENSLIGIMKALEMSQSNSIIYLFTDASAKSRGQFNAIENLCRASHTQVIIFMSGSCKSGSANNGYVDVYYDIANVCSGTVFKINAYDLRKVFRYIKDMIITDYNDVINYDAFSGHKQFKLSVDSFTTSILIAVSGEYPTVQVSDATGRSPFIEKLLDTRHSLIVRLSNLGNGEYHISASCQGMSQVTIYKRNRMPFEFGFSTVQPYSIKETSPRPIPGRNNYIYIKLQHNQNIILNSIVIEYVKVNEMKSLSLEQREDRKDCYFAIIFVEPAKPFVLRINGKDVIKYDDITVSTKIINPQTAPGETRWLSPRTEIIPPEPQMIDYLTNTSIACKVVGLPKPKIWWEDDAYNQLSSEDVLIEIPSVYISYVSIENMTANFTVTCKAKNTVGESSNSMQLFVNRPFTFEFTMEPQNETFEYGSSGMIYCKVEAYPQAEIRWLYNGTAVEYFENIEVLSDEHAIKIKNMTLNDTGTYTCEAYNSVKMERLSAIVGIAGLELPDVEAQEAKIYVKPGDWVDIECRIIKGNPEPEISWKYKSNDDYEFKLLPSDAFAEHNKVNISVVAMKHRGTYKCTAVNMLGEDSDEIYVEIEYPPKILNFDTESLTTKEGELVELSCEVDAIPEATVKWELTHDDLIVPFDDSRHITNDEHTHTFDASWEDSGSYHCIAENRVGKTEKTINVNVLVPPYIKPVPVEEREMVVKAGSDVTLSCIILYGNPVPSTEWRFIAPDSTSVTLTRSSANIFLNLKAVTKDDEGLYICVADNEIANDRIRIQLIVQ